MSRMKAKNREVTALLTFFFSLSRFAETEHLMRNVAYKGIRDESAFSRDTNGLESNRVAIVL